MILQMNIYKCNQTGLDIKAFGLPALGQVDLKTYLPSY